MDNDDKRRYFIVGSVIMEVVTPLFRTRLERDYTSKGLPSLQAFLNTQPVIHILFHLRHRNARCCVDGLNCYNHPSLPLIYCQWKRLYSEKPGHVHHDCHCKFTANPIQLEDLDITLSSLILLNCYNLTQSEDAAVQGLRQYKNDYLSHNTTGRISHTEYKSLWTDLTHFVLQLDPSKQDDMIRIERRPLDESLCNSYTLNLLDIHKKLDEMDTSIQGIRAEIQGQNAHMQEILLYIKKDGCACLCEKSEQQKDHIKIKQYKLGQDVFQLHHQINLTSHIPKGFKGTVANIVMVDDGRVIMCLPHQYTLLIFNADGSHLDRINVDGGPDCVAEVNNFTVAVTLKDSKSLELYDINNKLKIKSIAVPGLRWWIGITTINNHLVVGGSANRLLIIDHKKEEVVKTIKTDCVTYRLHGSGDKIFYNDYYYINTRNLYWYSYTDDRHYTLPLPSTPMIMTTLQDGSLYVKCEDGSVQHVSSDGKQYKTVTKKGLKKTDCLAYNRKQRQLVTITINQKKNQCLL